MTIEAIVTLKSDAVAGVGRDRIRLLGAVARAGSISAGAKAVGLSYKAAWDALDAMTNLFGRPLLTTHTGGREGGGASLTPTGTRVIAAFDHLEAELARVLRAVEPGLAGTGISPLNLVSGLFMKTSARNVLRGTISEISASPVTAEVGVKISADTTIHALVTATSLRELNLHIGREAIVLIKASFVMIAAGKGPLALSARNCLPGKIARCETSSVNAEVILDIGDGRTLAATVTARSVAALGLKPGKPACALFDASHVIIATD